MVEDQSLEILAPVLAEQESIDLGAELLEGEVGRSKQSTAGVIGAVVSVKETSLAKSQLKGGELGRQEINDLEGSRRRNEEIVNSVNNSVGTENVDGNDARVEVDGQASEAEVDAESLSSLARQVLTLQQSGDGVGDENSAGRVEIVTDMVLDELLDLLLAWLVVGVIRECSILWRKHSQVSIFGGVEFLNQFRVLADELGELLSVLGRAKQLPDSLVRLVTVVRASMMRVVPVVGRAMVRRVRVLVAVQSVVCTVGSRLEP